MRSRGVPARTASITRRTAARTSSSASDTSTMRVRSMAATEPGVAFGRLGDRRRQADHRGEHVGVGARRPSIRRAPSRRRPRRRPPRTGSARVLRAAAAGRRRPCRDRRRRFRPRAPRPPKRIRSCSSYHLGSNRARRAVEADDVGGAGRLRRDRAEALLGHLAQLSVGRDQRGLGGGMLGHRGEEAGLLAQRGAQRRRNHRSRHRAPAGRGELRRSE